MKFCFENNYVFAEIHLSNVHNMAMSVLRDNREIAYLSLLQAVFTNRM